MAKAYAAMRTTGSACKRAKNSRQQRKAKVYKAVKAARSPKRISVSGHDSNDSVLVADYLAEFSYDPKRKDAVLEKYQRLLG